MFYESAYPEIEVFDALMSIICILLQVSGTQVNTQFKQ